MINYRVRYKSSLNSLLSMCSLIDDLLQIFEGTLDRSNSKEHFCRLLLYHCNIVDDGLVIGLDMESLRGSRIKDDWGCDGGLPSGHIVGQCSWQDMTGPWWLSRTMTDTDTTVPKRCDRCRTALTPSHTREFHQEMDDVDKTESLRFQSPGQTHPAHNSSGPC